MIKSFACPDAGLSCGARVTGASDREVLEKAVGHPREKHAPRTRTATG